MPLELLQRESAQKCYGYYNSLLLQVLHYLLNWLSSQMFLRLQVCAISRFILKGGGVSVTPFGRSRWSATDEPQGCDARQMCDLSQTDCGFNKCQVSVLTHVLYLKLTIYIGGYFRVDTRLTVWKWQNKQTNNYSVKKKKRHRGSPLATWCWGCGSARDWRWREGSPGNLLLDSPPFSSPLRTNSSVPYRQTDGWSLRGNGTTTTTTTTGKTNSHLPPHWKQQTVAARNDKERSGQGRWGTPSATVCCERTAGSVASTERQPVVESGRTVTVARSSRAQGF